VKFLAMASAAGEDTSSASLAERIQFLEAKDRALAEKQELLQDALHEAIETVKADGFHVNEASTAMAKQRAESFGKDRQDMVLQARRVLLCEAAVAAVIQRAKDRKLHEKWAGQTCHAYSMNVVVFQMEDMARTGALMSKSDHYEIIEKNAEQALENEKRTYVITISGWTQMGVDIVVHMCTIGGESFNMTVPRGTSVDKLSLGIWEDRLCQKSEIKLLGQSHLKSQHLGYRVQGSLDGKTDVKLVGPAGTILDGTRRLPDAIDFESIDPDKEDGEFFDLAVLRGTAWKELGLDAATRWQYLRERDFVEIFGMSKDAFGKLPSWKQIPLKKKHGFF